MAKVICVFITLLALHAAKSHPMIPENHKLSDLHDISQYSESKHASEDRTLKLSEISANSESGVQNQLSHLLIRSGRRKRSIITGGTCPVGQVWKPRPFYCITCEEYEELSGNDC